jgi:hypothetical protein
VRELARAEAPAAPRDAPAATPRPSAPDPLLQDLVAPTAPASPQVPAQAIPKPSEQVDRGMLEGLMGESGEDKPR